MLAPAEPAADVVGGGWLQTERLVEQETGGLRLFNTFLMLVRLCSTCNSIINVPLFFPNTVCCMNSLGQKKYLLMLS